MKGDEIIFLPKSTVTLSAVIYAEGYARAAQAGGKPSRPVTQHLTLSDLYNHPP